MADFLPEDDIVRYIDGEMAEEERLFFEKRLERDPLLRQKVEELTTASEVVKYYGIADQVARVHHKLKPSLAPIKQSGKLVPVRRYLRYGIAIAASLIFILATWQAYNFFSLSPEAVYAEGYVDYSIPTARSEGNTDTSSILTLYKKGNYDSLVKLERKRPAETDQEYLVTGLSHLKLDDAFAAIMPLETVVAMQNSSFRQDGEYYLAMAYLKNKDFDKALELMQIISDNPNHLYSDQFSNKYLRKVRMLKWR